jgi:carbon-monoxide dehydrogenase large subunit
VSFRDVARAVYSDMARLPQDAREELAATKTYDPVFGTTTSATHIAALQIDPDTTKCIVHPRGFRAITSPAPV